MVRRKVERIEQCVWFNAQGKRDVGKRYPKGRHCSEWSEAEVCQYSHQPSGSGNPKGTHVLHEWNDNIGDGFADPGGCCHKTDGHAAYDKEYKLEVDAVNVFLLDHTKAWECKEGWGAIQRHKRVLAREYWQ